ncbi:uncharacterized protein LOC121591851 [Anopheles merus]|uniref:Uncharacterized protein n=1 Tax=Anopheles merus TaxID=30066 RepID=A0A182V0M2_ANOME|nr:uncharacterized protein LOC121591851 [Anopheles merus]
MAPLLLLCTLCAVLLPTANAQAVTGSKAANGTTCPEADVAIRDVTPQQCCGSFLEAHKAIIDCMGKTGTGSGTSCIAHCILQNFHTQKLLVGSAVSVSQMITIGPKLFAHYERCHTDLFEYVIGNVFDGDFRRVICDERLNRFFECMVRSWFEDCLGFDDANPKCGELQKVVKSSSCSLSSFFTKPETA